MSGPTVCQVCGSTTDDACVRCERPTCPEHFFDQDHLALCNPCKDALEEIVAASPRGLTHWPYPVRKLKPEWQPPAGTSSPPIDPSD